MLICKEFFNLNLCGIILHAGNFNFWLITDRNFHWICCHKTFRRFNLFQQIISCRDPLEIGRFISAYPLRSIPYRIGSSTVWIFPNQWSILCFYHIISLWIFFRIHTIYPSGRIQRQFCSRNRTVCIGSNITSHHLALIRFLSRFRMFMVHIQNCHFGILRRMDLTNFNLCGPVNHLNMLKFSRLRNSNAARQPLHIPLRCL